MRALTAALIVGALMCMASNGLSACGDKFLLVGRGARFHRAYAALYPAGIVVYAQARRNVTGAIGDRRFLSDLKLAGHRVSLVEDETGIGRALQAGAVDIVLADSADVDDLAARAQGSPSRPVVLPVSYKAPREQAKELEHRFGWHLQSSDRIERFLTTIDDAMKARVDQRKKRAS